MSDAELTEQVTADEVVSWLAAKLADAEKSLKAREQMEQTWRDGTDETWKAVARANGTKYMTAPQRRNEADMQGRIAAKCRRDVVMFKTLLLSWT